MFRVRPLAREKVWGRSVRLQREQRRVMSPSRQYVLIMCNRLKCLVLHINERSMTWLGRSTCQVVSLRSIYLLLAPLSYREFPVCTTLTLTQIRWTPGEALPFTTAANWEQVAQTVSKLYPAIVDCLRTVQRLGQLFCCVLVICPFVSHRPT